MRTDRAPATTRAAAAAGCAVVAGAVAILVGLVAGTPTVPPPVLAAMTAVPAWSLCAAALLLPPPAVAPQVRALLVVLSGAWLVGALPYPSSPEGAWIAAALGGIWVAVLAHLLLVLPDGSPLGRAGWAAVVGAYVIASPGNVFAATASASAITMLGAAQVTFGLALVVLLSRRLAALTVVARRSLGPVLLAGGLAVVALIVIQTVALDTRRGPLSPATPDSWAAVLTLAYAGVLTLLPAGLAVARTRAHLDQARIADLARTLGDYEAGPLGAGPLRAALAQALGDPSVQVHYWLPDPGAWVDASGAVHQPSRLPGRAWTPIVRDGTPVAALDHAAGPPDRDALVRAVTATARLALENQRLRADLAARLVEVRASRARLVAAADTERRRLERNLHDGAQQSLVSASVLLSLAVRRTSTAADAPTAQAVRAAAEAVRAAAEAVRAGIAELRELARGLHPAILTAAGLGPALQALADRAPCR